MDIKSWVKPVAVAKVKLALETYGLKVFKNTNLTVHGDIIANWNRNKKSYLIYIVPVLKKNDVEEKTFTDTLAYCKENNLRLIIIAWEHENKLFDYSMDLEDGENLAFKLIRFERMEQLLKEYVELSK